MFSQGVHQGVVKAVCDEVWVVDSFSTDGTQQIAEREGANFVQHEYEYQARQFNWAIDNLPIRAEWIWRVDADEIIEPGLAEIALRELPKLPDSVTGVYVNKKIVFMGRPLLHGGWYPAPQIKLVRRGHGRSEDKLMDEHLIVTDGETVSWNGDQTDWNLQNLDWWWQKHIGYAKREARMQVKTPSIPLEGEECRVSSAESRVKSEDRRDASVEGKLFGTDAEWALPKVGKGGGLFREPICADGRIPGRLCWMVLAHSPGPDVSLDGGPRDWTIKT